MAQWIIKANGRVVPHLTAVPLTTAQHNSETEKKKRALFEKIITKRWGTSIYPLSVTIDTTTDNLLDPYEDRDEPALEMPQLFDPVDVDTAQLLDKQPSYDQMIHSEVALTQCDRLLNAKILRR